MHVVATAGHVDHGKSTLVRALTGSDPDRLAEERRRGLSIELGYCWMSLPGVGDLAFVDVPGHERFIATMLAGIGPVPAALFVVAADDPWMPQAAEHLAALDALGVSRAVLAVTRCDLADPAPMLERARTELSRTALRDARAVAVSARTGEGLARLKDLLREMVGTLPAPSPDAGARLWVDRAFHVRGAGTVVTGTLPAGRIRVGDLLGAGDLPGAGDRSVRVRGMESLGEPVRSVQGVARVALNVTGSGVGGLDRGSVLVTPGAWQLTETVDVRLVPAGEGTRRLPARPVLHIGAAVVSVRARPLPSGPASEPVACQAVGYVRLRLDRGLPLVIGDRALLRDPGSRALWGVTVLDPMPAPLRGRGSARERAGQLATEDGVPDLGREVRRRGSVRVSVLRRLGVDVSGVAGVALVAGDWLLSEDRAETLRDRLAGLLREHDRRMPLDPGLPVPTVVQALGLPTSELVPGLLRPPMRLAGGRVLAGSGVVLPAGLERALGQLECDLGEEPFGAPTADRLRSLGLDARAIAAAARAGRLLRVGEAVVLLPGADALAAERLGDLSQPFSVGEARVRLHTTRRVALPLLAHLDAQGRTRRLPDDRRYVIQGGGRGPRA